MTFSIQFDGNGLALDGRMNSQIGALVTTTRGVFPLTAKTVLAKPGYVRTAPRLQQFAIPLGALPEDIQVWARRLLEIMPRMDLRALEGQRQEYRGGKYVDNPRVVEQIKALQAFTIPDDHLVAVISSAFRRGRILEKNKKLEVVVLPGSALSGVRLLGKITGFELVSLVEQEA